MPKFKKEIYPEKGSVRKIEVVVEAKNAIQAKELLQMQYGKDRLVGSSMPIKV